MVWCFIKFESMNNLSTSSPPIQNCYAFWAPISLACIIFNQLCAQSSDLCRPFRFSVGYQREYCSSLELLWHRAIEMERTTDDHVVLFEQTLATNLEVLIENQKLREKLKQRDEENFENSWILCSSCSKTGTTQESADCPRNLTKDCPSSIILSGKYYWLNMWPLFVCLHVRFLAISLTGVSKTQTSKTQTSDPKNSDPLGVSKTQTLKTQTLWVSRKLRP